MTDNINDEFTPAGGHDGGHQAPNYQQPHEHDNAYQPIEQGDVPNYQPQVADDLQEAGGVHDPAAAGEQPADPSGEIAGGTSVDEAGIIGGQG